MKRNILILLIFFIFCYQAYAEVRAASSQVKEISAAMAPAKKTELANRILMAYKYHAYLWNIVDQHFAKDAELSKFENKDVRLKIYREAFAVATIEVSRLYSDSELVRLANLFESPDGQLMVSFGSKIFEKPNERIVQTVISKANEYRIMQKNDLGKQQTKRQISSDVK